MKEQMIIGKFEILDEFLAVICFCLNEVSVSEWWMEKGHLDGRMIFGWSILFA